MRGNVRLGILFALAAGIAAWSLIEKPAALPDAAPALRPRPERIASDRDPAPLADERIDAWLKQAGRDTPGTLAKILELEDPEEREELLDWILSAWTAEDRGPALNWLEKSISTLDANTAAEPLEWLVGSWALEEPLAAMKWVTDRLPEPTREAGLQIIASHWALADPESMGRWISSQSSPAEFWVDELIHGLIGTDPVKALGWCDRLGDPAVAESSRESVILSWQLTAPDEAAAYLKDHPELTPASKPENSPGN